MVTPVNAIKTNQEKEIFLKPILVFMRYNVNKICKNIYVKKHFQQDMVWSSENLEQNSNTIEKHNNGVSLLMHYHSEQNHVINSHAEISSCFDVN